MDPGLTRLLLFAVLGAGLKAVDRAYDEGDLDRRLAFFIAPLLAVIWVHLSISNALSATILGAIFLSSLLTRKIDNPAFKIAALIVAAAFLVWGYPMAVLPLLFLTLLGALDEIANGYGDRNKTHGFEAFFLKHRFGMKGGVLLLYASSVIDLTHVLALLSFDLAYETMSIRRAPNYRVALSKVMGGML